MVFWGSDYTKKLLQGFPCTWVLEIYCAGDTEGTQANTCSQEVYNPMLNQTILNRGWWKIKDNAHSDNPTKLCFVSGEWGGSWEKGRRKFQRELWPTQTEPCAFTKRIHLHKEEMESRGVLVCPTDSCDLQRKGAVLRQKNSEDCPIPLWHVAQVLTHTHNAEAGWVLMISSVTTTLIQYKNSLFYEVNQGCAVFLSLWNDKSCGLRRMLEISNQHLVFILLVSNNPV